MKVLEAIEKLESHADCSWGGLNEAFELAISALKKQVAIEPIYSGYDNNGFDEFIPYEALCPICGYAFEFGKFNNEDNHHCICGQKIEWDRRKVGK